MAAESQRNWTFLTNHAHVLVCIARDSGMRMRDIAQAVGITERAAQSILSDLISEGYVTRTRIGRRNDYVINQEKHLRHELEHERLVGELLDVLARES
ncbi:winged helix-turn-helix transcriptional regulator [Hoyosella rhizosphaerae]|uniref:ArsR family transcriptional regulator n=1 Tax=Hoyosella rhizosphaerae TaxID=1755582 RepID=A0A916TYW5_9ACTN|nr:winged helix-turn-helix domain-containing protein [Hoyosella rhizosphaerae]MBN4927189.1 winged helix-turn-helix transcriptional regulator [Hoyosella rhizosphaerae]GGC53317.1 ArsR family transcriptional regulator [Hoyosella rhizosphaerae]